MTRRKHRLPMSDPMIQAIRREIRQPGTGKTQTRRIVNPQPTSDDIDNVGDCETIIDMATGRYITSPYGQPGDLLAFTETFAFGVGYDELPPREVPALPQVLIWRQADGEATNNRARGRGRWRPARFMPYWCCRYTGVVTDVRLERVKEISEAEGIAEGATRREAGWCMDWSRVGQISRFAGGIHPPGKGQPLQEWEVSLGSPRWAFAEYWERLHGDGAWTRNDWVWVYTFRPIPVNVLEVERDPAAYGLGEAA